MPALSAPPIESKAALQARLAAIEAEERRVDTIENSRRRLHNAVTNAETRLAAGNAMLEKLRESAAEQWSDLTEKRLHSTEEIIRPGLQVGDIDGRVLESIATEFARAQFSDFRISRANEKWIVPCESALESARAELAAFTKSNPEPKSNP